MATKFTKKNFKSIVSDGKGGSVLLDNKGYEFTAFAVDGNVLNMHVAEQDDGMWHVIDPRTGLELAKGKTRSEAVEEATKPDTVMYFSNLYRSEKYTKFCNRFIDLVAVKPKAPKAEPAVPRAKKEAKPSRVKAPSVPKVKGTKKEKDVENSELMQAIRQLAEVTKELEELKSGKLDEMIAAKADAMFGEVYEKIHADLDKIIDGITVEQADKMADELPAEVKVATEWTLESAREWANAHGFTADQVNPERKDCIWIYGVRKDDKPTHKELVEMGFRFGKKGWYFDPKRV